MPVPYILLPAAYFIFVTLWFTLVQKPLFYLLDHGCNTRPFTSHDVAKVYTNGIKSDFIIASYLTFIPLILCTVRAIAGPGVNLALLLSVYNVIMAAAVTLITLSDAVLYRYWQYKLEASVFQYLRHPKGAFASVSTLYLTGALLAIVIFAAAYYFAAAAFCTPMSHGFAPKCPGLWRGAVIFLIFLLLGVALFLITRGLKVRPNNPSIVYFSPNPFLNHWALNPAYNLIYSLTTREKFDDQFRFYPEEEARAVVDGIFPLTSTPQTSLLTTTRPNILLIVWESLGAEFVEALGGRPDITPRISALAEEGVLFTRCTAGSFRTDRGLVCVLGGYPGQPTTSVMRYTRKLPNLPALPRRLREEGYVTTAIHGGDLSIMHKADWYLASGHDRLLSLKDFGSSAPAGKWGIEDGWMLDRVFDDIMEHTEKGERWFTTLQTLSSHEPFKVPYARLDNEVDNSFAYVDDAVGKFVDRLKETPAWKDTLIVIVADHGYNISHHPVDRASYAHIPLMMLGGAVKTPRRIDTLMSQTDLAATLLGQMGLPHDEFIFSRDILADTYTRPFSFHTYNNGYLITDERGMTQVDNSTGAVVAGTPDPERERMARSILQRLYSDLARR